MSQSIRGPALIHERTSQVPLSAATASVLSSGLMARTAAAPALRLSYRVARTAHRRATAGIGAMSEGCMCHAQRPLRSTIERAGWPLEVRRRGAPHTLKKVSQTSRAAIVERKNQPEASSPTPSRSSLQHSERAFARAGQPTCRRRLQNQAVGVGLRQPSLPPTRWFQA
eukprot:2536073-Prymnesium_polylepis.3